VPVDGWHRQTPEHVTVTVGVRIVHPALQMQLVKAALPAGELEFDGQALHAEAPTAVEYVPAAQSVQVAFPFNALYFPATHAVHEPPSGPENPALQAQLVKPRLPAGELEFAGHARQFLKKCTYLAGHS
jgi:hypothetical protein